MSKDVNFTTLQHPLASSNNIIWHHFLNLGSAILHIAHNHHKEEIFLVNCNFICAAKQMYTRMNQPTWGASYLTSILQTTVSIRLTW